MKRISDLRRETLKQVGEAAIWDEIAVKRAGDWLRELDLNQRPLGYE